MAIARRLQQIQDAGPSLTRDEAIVVPAQAFMSYVGIAPVKEESGKKRWVHWQASPARGFPSVGNWRDGLAPSFSGKPLLNGLTNPDAFLLGHKLFTNSKNGLVKLIKQQFGHWLTSGAEFFGVVGKIVHPTMRRNTWPL